MKPAPFDYFAPQTLDEALQHLAQHGDEAKLLAGGQSLVPAMNFRLAQPGVLIDLNGISELNFIRAAKNEGGDSGDSGLHIGAMTRQSAVERSDLVAERQPLVRDAMPYIAHRQIRNRGTVGGSLAHADPAAELPAVAVALGARMRAQSQRGARWIDAVDFYVSLFATALEPDEILTEVRLPALPAHSGWSIQELARRHGDYAIVGVAVVVTLDEAGRCADARIVFLSVGEGPVQARQAVQVLRGETPSDALFAEAAQVAAARDIDPLADIHATAAYRRHLAQVLTRRALVEAFGRAQNKA